MFGLTFLIATTLSTAAPSTIPAYQAAAAFAQARTLCTKDNGRLWGVSLCGPIVLVDPATHQAVANEPVAGAVKDRGVYRLVLPANVSTANTSILLGKRRWAEILWPLPRDRNLRGSLLMHESFHRVQPLLGFTARGGLGGNTHLDTEQGRILLRGELNALREAIVGTTVDQRRAALRDAVALRLYRRSLFPGAAKQEQALEINEGLAESTAVDVAIPPRLRAAFALRDLKNVEKSASYVREFPYGTGPAYAQLLDRIEPAWRKHANSQSDLALLAARAYGLHVERITSYQAYAVLSRYGGRSIIAEEQERDMQQRVRTRRYEAEFAHGVSLKIPLGAFNITFDPRAVEAFGSRGTVYHTLHLSGGWGVLDVKGADALISPDFRYVFLPIGSLNAGAGPVLQGPNWTLNLAGGYHVKPATSPEDFYVVVKEQ